MKHKSFLYFFFPTALAMFLFIGLPIISVVVQSLHKEHEQVFKIVENCGPFGCREEAVVDTDATEKIKEEKPLGRWAGLEIYFDRGHLAVAEIASFWNSSKTFKEFFSSVLDLPFYRALSFTLAYTFIVTPLLIMLGFIIAITVNSINQRFKGLVIFFSLLPMIITPLIGSLILFWMIDSRGIIGSGLQWIFDDPDLSLKSSTWLTWIMLMVYGVWHSAPFAFIVFYAGLQTLPQDTLEAAMMDGATHWQRIRYVVFPHIIPLAIFVALIQLMDNFRVFEPIVGFNSEAHATSLSWIIFNDLNAETQLLSSAATTSVLTIIGVTILLCPMFIRTWLDFDKKA